MTDLKIPVEMEIQEVKEVHQSIELDDGGPHNDWWPTTKNWTTFDVIFTNGARKSYDNLDAIQLVNDNELQNRQR